MRPPGSAHRRASLALSLVALPVLLSICPAFSARAADDYRRSATFLLAADPQVGTEPESGFNNADYKAKSASLVASTKTLNTIKWPSTVSLGGQVIETPLGVVLLGDLTQHASIYKYGLSYTAPEFEIFRSYFEYPPGPDVVFKPEYNSVPFPVYVGLGNHDLVSTRAGTIQGEARNSMWNYVKERHCGSSSFVPAASYDPGSDAYSWDWGILHCVQLHRYGGDTGETNWILGKPASSLSWLAGDLNASAHKYAEIVRPVILFQHFAWRAENGNQLPTNRVPDEQWSLDEAAALNNVVSTYNVIAAFHGHYHSSQVSSYTVPYLTNSRFPRAVPVFDVPRAPSAYGVVHVGDDGLHVGGMEAHWANQTWSMRNALEDTFSLYNPAPPVLREFCTSSNWTAAMARHLADVNGDGRDDIIGFKDDGCYVAFARETDDEGEPFEPPRLVLRQFDGQWLDPECPVLLGDVDANGRTDIVGFGYGSVVVALAKGAGDFNKDHPFRDPVAKDPAFRFYTYGAGWRAGVHLRTLADVDGDGRDGTVFI